MALIELIVFRSSHFAKLVYGRGDITPLFRAGRQWDEIFHDENLQIDEELIRLLSHLDIGQFLTSPALWAGLIVCGVFTTGAIYIRRYRDES